MRTEYFLKTERLGFRKWNNNDFLLAKGLWGDYNVTKLIDIRGQLTDEQVMARLLKEISCEQNYSVQYFPIFLLDTGEHVGCCGLRPYNLKENIYELGFHIRTKYWKKGYAYESAKAIMEFAFTEMKVSSLYAGHHPNNESSRNILQKLGFTYKRDEFYKPTGLNHPSYLLRKEDYELTRSQLK
jgi:ribosomal-protein-alanine N-acetyltransferase